MPEQKNLPPEDAAYRKSMTDIAAKEDIDLVAAARELGLESVDDMSSSQIEDAVLSAPAKKPALADADRKTDKPTETPLPKPAPGMSIEERMAEMQKQFDAQRVALEAQLAAALQQNASRAAPAGTMVSHGVRPDDSEERTLLFRQAEQLGLKMAPNASTEGMRANIERHLTDKVQSQLAVEELERRQAQNGPAVRVKVRVLPMGDNQISKGFHISGLGDAMYKYGDTFDIERSIARAQQAAGRVEIIGVADVPA